MVMQSLNTGLTGKAFKLILLGVLFAAVAGLVMTDVGGFFRNGGVSRMDVARIGRKTIGVNEFAQDYRRALQQSGINEDAARQMNLPLMVLQQDIGREVLLQAASRMGVRISDRFVASNIKKQLDAMKMPGTDAEKLDMVLRQQNISERQLVTLLRGDFAINTVTAAISPKHITPLDDMINELYKAQSEKRAAEMATITPADFKEKPTVDAKALDAYFAENKEKYRTLEKRSLSFIVFPKSLFTPNVAITDEDVQKYYDEHKNQFMKPARVRMEQVIVKDKEAAEKIAEEKPASLATYNTDGAQPVATDWYTQSSMPKQLADVIFNDKKQTGIIGPVQSDLGWHVLRVEDYQDSTPAAFAEVKDVIKRQLTDEKLDEATNEFSDNVDKLVTGGGSLDDLAQQYKQTPKTVADITQVNAGEKLKAMGLPDAITQRLQESVFALGDDEISPLIDTPEGDYLLVQVTNVVPSVVPELSTIKDRVQADAEKSAEAKALTDMAENIIGQYDPKKADSFTALAGKNNLTVSTTTPATQVIAAKEYGQDIGQMIFTLSPDNDLSYVTEDGKVTLVHLKSVSRDNAKPDKETHDKIAEALSKSTTQELQQQFVGAWQDKLGVAINNDLLQKQFLEKSSD